MVSGDMTWSTFWDAFTAVGTVAMAVTTVLVIRQNTQEHQDRFRPICVLVPDDGLDHFARRNIVQCHEDSARPGKFYLLKCGVKEHRRRTGTLPASCGEIFSASRR